MSQIFIINDFLPIDFINQTKRELLNYAQYIYYIDVQSNSNEILFRVKKLLNY